MSAVDLVLAAARRLADASSVPGRAVREASCVEGPSSPAMSDAVWALTCARYTPTAVNALASDRLAGERVAVVLARSVVTAPLRALSLPLLAGASRVMVRASGAQRALVAAVAEAFACDAIEVIDTLPHAMERVMVYGRDETLDAIAQNVAPEIAFEGRGHGYGIAYVGAPDDAAAQAVARDVALYDQRGCLSPQQVFVRGDAVGFARSLHEALGALAASLPRARLTVGDAAAVAQWQGAAAARSAWFRRGATHGVGATEGVTLAGTPGWRNVLVTAVRGEAEVASLLGARAREVTAVGVAGAIERGEWGFVSGRVVPAGAMQDPPLDGPEDVRPPRARDDAWNQSLGASSAR